MLVRTFARLSAVVALALGLLVATAIPASASATGVVIEGSSVVVFGSSNGFDRHFQGHPTTHVCAPNSTTAPTIPVSFDSTGGGTVGATNTEWADLPYGMNTYKTRMIIDSGTMSLSATGISVTLVVRFQYATCASTQILCTTNPVSVTMSGPSVGHHPTASTRVTVAGNSTTITTPITCISTIRAFIYNTTASASLDLHFV